MKNIFKKVMKKILIIISVFFIFLNPVFSYAEEDVIIADPTPDTTGPTLKSLSISSNEASPGSQVKLIADVADDLSGVDSVYISFKLPSGSSKGYYLYLDQSTKKYQTIINFDKYYENGNWVPSYISLKDKKDNSTTVHEWDWNSYTIQVSGGSKAPIDSVNPVLKDFALSTSKVTSDQYVKLTAEAEDTDSGISYVYAYGYKPSGRSFSCYLYLNSATGLYEDSIPIDKYDELGEWKISYVNVSDKAGNSITVKNGTIDTTDSNKIWDFSNYKFEVSGTTPDLIGPILDTLAINVEQGTSNNAIVKLKATLRDSLSGISSLSAYYQKPNGKKVYVNFQYNYSTLKFEASIPIDKYDLLGKWELTSLSMLDNKENSQTLYRGSTDAIMFSDFDFTVRGLITTSPAAPFSVTLNYNSLSLEPGQSQQLNVTLNMTDDSKLDITNTYSGTVYISSNPSAVSVNQKGLITVNPNAKPGKVSVQVSNRGKIALCEITIPGAGPKDTLLVSPINVNLFSGQTKQLSVISSLSNGTVKDVSTKETGTIYKSSDENKVKISENGLITIPATAVQGKAIVEIQHNGVIAQTVVNIIGPPVLQDLQMNPKTAEIEPNKTIQLSVKGILSDGSTRDLTNNSTGTTFISSDKSRAIVDSDGLISIPNDAQTGTVYITAVNNGKSIKSVIEVAAPSVSELEVSLSSAKMKRGENEQITVKAKMTDGVIKDVTNRGSGIKYSSNLISRVTVKENGLITIPEGATAGEAIITIRYGGKTETITITIPPPPTVERVEIGPIADTMKQSQTQQLSVTATMTDGEIIDVTPGSTGIKYSSKLLSRATVSTNGLITIPSGATGGTVTITVTYSGKTATTTIKIPSPPTIERLEVNSISETMKQGETQQLVVTATMTDGEVKDLTQGSTGTKYSSNLLSRATVSADGLITIPAGSSGGTVIITVSHGGKIALGTITVPSPPTVDHLELTQENGTMKQGENQQLVVQAVMSDGEIKDVTLGSTGTKYSSNLLSRATVSTDGLISIPDGATGGIVKLTVSYGGKTTTSIITVSNSPAVDHLELEPINSAMKRGENQQILVTAVSTDGTKRDVTLGSVGTKYSSNLLSRANVTTNGLITIPTGATNGLFKITVTYGGKQISLVLNIVN